MPTFYIDVELSGTVGLNITADDKDQAIKKAQNASYEATGIKVINSIKDVMVTDCVITSSRVLED